MKIHRSSHNNYHTFISNKKIYNNAKISRVDNFCIKLTRSFYAKNKLIKNKYIEENLKISNEDVFDKRMTDGYLPPHSFTNLGSNGLIQDSDNIPINTDTDKNDFQGINTRKYWWITEDQRVTQEIRKRAKKKNKRRRSEPP